MLMERRESDFFKAAQETGNKIAELNDLVIVHHFDADGIPAGAIIFSALFRNGVAPPMICWKKMTETNLATYQFWRIISGVKTYLS